MRSVPRITVTCALPGCGKRIALTQYQLDRRGGHPTCSRTHAGLLSSLDGMRQDEAGKFLAELKAKAGGHEALARRLRWPRVTLQHLERTPGRVPRDDTHIHDLTRVSGKTQDEVRRIFGWRQRTDRRTAAVVAFVRKRFPRDRARLAVAGRLEREGMSISAYGAAVGVDDELVRMWLLGHNAYLREPAWLAIAAHENFPQRLVTGTLRKAQKHWGKSLTKGRRKWSRRKRHRTSDNARRAKSDSRKRKWADPEWRETTGNAVVEKMQDGRRLAWASEERFLATEVRRIVGRFAHYASLATHEGAHTPEDVLWVLCQTLTRHRARFPESSLTFEALPEKAESILGEPLHTAIRAGGRPYDVPEIAAVIRLFARTPRPDPFWPEVSRRWYGTRNRADDAWERWSRFEKSVSEWISTRTARPHVDLMRRIFEAVLGKALTQEEVSTLTSLKPGKPPQGR